MYVFFQLPILGVSTSRKKIYRSVTEILVTGRQIEVSPDLGNRASPAGRACMKMPLLYGSSLELIVNKVLFIFTDNLNNKDVL